MQTFSVEYLASIINTTLGTAYQQEILERLLLNYTIVEIVIIT